MCEILIYSANRTHADPDKDRAGCYKRGYPVVVMDDGHTWGREESKAEWIASGRDPSQWPDYFYIIKLPGIDTELAREMIAEQTEDDTGQDTGSTYRRRRWIFDINSLQNAVRNTLLSTGEYTAATAGARNSMRSAIKRIRDNASYTGF